MPDAEGQTAATEAAQGGATSPAPPAQPAAPAPPAQPEAADAPPVTEPAPEANGEDWAPQRQDEASGIFYDGHGLPLNHRLRAIALADAGLEEDPASTLTPEAIAATAERLAAHDAAYPPISAKATTAELEKLAKAESVDISGAETNDERASLIIAARPARV